MSLLNQEELPETQTLRIDTQAEYIRYRLNRHQLLESLAKLSPPVSKIIFFVINDYYRKEYDFLKPLMERQLPGVAVSFVEQKYNDPKKSNRYKSLDIYSIQDVEEALAEDNPLQHETLEFNCANLASAKIHALFAKYHSVKSLRINKSLDEIPPYENPSLKRLDLSSFSSTFPLFQREIDQLLSNKPALQELNLYLKPPKSDDPVTNFKSIYQLPSLKNLKIRTGYKVTIDMFELFKNAKNLKELEFEGGECHFQHCETLPMLALETLIITIDGKRDFNGLLELLAKMPRLTELNLGASQNISTEQLKILLQQNPNITVFKLATLETHYNSAQELIPLLKERSVESRGNAYGK